MDYIKEDNYKNEMYAVVRDLKKRKVSGTFIGTSASIYYELFSVAEAKGWVVISHGFTESIAKYCEMIWYLNQAGYSVAMPEHRGHGRSHRDVKEKWLTNVDHFSDYRDDMISFIEEVVAPELKGAPLYVWGHSMGGAIAAHVAEYAPELPVTKYILSSPMIGPETGGIPPKVARVLGDMQALMGRGRTPIIGAGRFDPEEHLDLEHGCCTSEVRFDWYHEIQCNHPMFQNSGCTYNWLRESVKQTSWLLKPQHASEIHVPVLLLQAGKENMVKNELQDRFVALLSDGKKIVFPEAKHEIFRCSDEEVKLFMETILEFIRA